MSECLRSFKTMSMSSNLGHSEPKKISVPHVSGLVCQVSLLSHTRSEKDPIARLQATWLQQEQMEGQISFPARGTFQLLAVVSMMYRLGLWRIRLDACRYATNSRSTFGPSRLAHVFDRRSARHHALHVLAQVRMDQDHRAVSGSQIVAARGPIIV